MDCIFQIRVMDQWPAQMRYDILPSGSIRSGEFLEQLKDCYVSQEICARVT